MTSHTADRTVFYIAVLFAFSFFLTVCKGQDRCQGLENELRRLPGEVKTSCIVEYQRCERGLWRNARCEAGVIDFSLKYCTPFNTSCPATARLAELRAQGTIERKKREAFTEMYISKAETRASRYKRQTTVDCAYSYTCPSDLTMLTIYPDWTQCEKYIVCLAGELIRTTCKPDYNYYNPSRLSCEEYASRTNICVWRGRTLDA
ncbi:uncharacterized protein LOC101848210 isoform X1 [Aplysia californica]|uniref:Uncharacterized protein LOC101848210 isoform X1 n=1 Tax=Aplysia californica TaxID=6500 RepID=A0ABM0JUB8_APLCA|nr:uncharacterized protein LOC101848210 isoform X1 [Aplysia californica]XP_005101676.1 uncharacterized protein LOC101848210 isoform X1 [Aplysia californica]